VLKSNRAKNCLADRIAIFETLKSIIAEYDDRKCKVYLLHGDMTDEEMNSLYLHPKIKSFVLLTHGEGFGLPTFEAAYSGIPTVTTGWSGQLDFLVDTETGSDMFYNVAYDIQPIQPEAAWEGVLVKESMWAFPREASAKHQMRKCYEDLTGEDADTINAKFTNYAEKINDRFSAEKMYAQMVDSVCTALNIESDTDVIAQEVLSF
jgi:glycosyltransferase involved in cell wall biosynthesis